MAFNSSFDIESVSIENNNSFLLVFLEMSLLYLILPFLPVGGINLVRI
jgi:hypothetical protein